MRSTLFTAFTLCAVSLITACSNTITLQVKAIKLDPPLLLDSERELSETEIQGVHAAVEQRMYPRKPSVHDVSPLHADEGGGVLAWWLAAKKDPTAKHGYTTDHGMYILDYIGDEWVIR